MRIMALVFSEISCIHCIINRADSCNKVREAESIEWASRVFSDELIQYSDVWSGSRSHQFIHGSSSLKPKEVWWCDPKFGKWNETDRFCPPDICYAGSNIMMRLDSKRALGRNHIINGVNFNMHQNASLIFVCSPCDPAFQALNFHEYRYPLLLYLYLVLASALKRSTWFFFLPALPWPSRSPAVILFW